MSSRSRRRFGSPRAAVLAALAVGLVLRLAFALGYWHDQPLTHDEREYLTLAANVAAGRGFEGELPGAEGDPMADHFSRAPLYPAFLASVLVATGRPLGALPASVPVAVQIVQAGIGLVSIWFLAVLAARVAGPAAGTAAAWMAALHPVFVVTPASALTECVSTAVVLAAVAALDAHARQPGGSRSATLWAAGGGALTGIAVLVRSASLVLAAVAVIWLLARRRLVPALAFALCVVGIVAPWTARNAIVHGRFVIVSAEGGVNFWIGNHPEAIGEGDLASNPRLEQAHVAFRAGLDGLTPEQQEPRYYRAALAAIAADPAGWLGLLARKAFYLAVPVGPSYRLRSLRYQLGSVIPYVLLLVPACIGFARLRRAGTIPAALCLLPVSYVVMCLVFFPQERFRAPAVDTALIVWAAAAMAGTTRPRSRTA
jgi:hypothetical protein